MTKKIVDFIKYHNAFTVAFVMLFFGFGVSFAANDNVQRAVFTTEETITSVDNTAILTTDLDSFNFNLKVDAVTEDVAEYNVRYSYRTLSLEDGAWSIVDKNKTLVVSKEALGENDLGVYVAEELGENIDHELAFLKRVKEQESDGGRSQKVVTVKYSGIVGKLINPKAKKIEGYEPVVPPATEEDSRQDDGRETLEIEITQNEITIPESTDERDSAESRSATIGVLIPTDESEQADSTSPEHSEEQSEEQVASVGIQSEITATTERESKVESGATSTSGVVVSDTQSFESEIVASPEQEASTTSTTTVELGESMLEAGSTSSNEGNSSATSTEANLDDSSEGNDIFEGTHATPTITTTSESTSATLSDTNSVGILSEVGEEASTQTQQDGTVFDSASVTGESGSEDDTEYVESANEETTPETIEQPTDLASSSTTTPQ
jgi:hypothetical protein